MNDRKSTILTRSARKQAGLPSPPSLFENDSYKQNLVASDEKYITIAHSTSMDNCSNPNKEKDNISETNNQFIWVQCDDCQKWRKIDKNFQDSLEDMWYCRMNTDPTCQSCDIPEEDWELPGNGWIYTYQGLLPGQLVWAKQNGYPPCISWPGIVSPDPWCFGTYISFEKDAEGSLYHVEFLGKTRTHLWLPEEMVEPYREKCSLYGKSHPRVDWKHNKCLQHAISEADSLVTLSNEERLGMCKFTGIKKFKEEFIQNENISDGANILKEKSRSKNRTTSRSRKKSTRSPVKIKSPIKANLLLISNPPSLLECLKSSSDFQLFDIRKLSQFLLSHNSVFPALPTVTQKVKEVHKSSLVPVVMTQNNTMPSTLSIGGSKANSQVLQSEVTNMTKSTSNLEPNLLLSETARGLSNCQRQHNSQQSLLTCNNVQCSAKKRKLYNSPKHKKCNQMNKERSKKRREQPSKCSQSQSIRQYFESQTAVLDPCSNNTHNILTDEDPLSDQVVPNNELNNPRTIVDIQLDDLECDAQQSMQDIEKMLADLESKSQYNMSLQDSESDTTIDLEFVENEMSQIKELLDSL